MILSFRSVFYSSLATELCHVVSRLKLGHAVFTLSPPLLLPPHFKKTMPVLLKAIKS